MDTYMDTSTSGHIMVTYMDTRTNIMVTYMDTYKDTRTNGHIMDAYIDTRTSGHSYIDTRTYGHIMDTYMETKTNRHMMDTRTYGHMDTSDSLARTIFRRSVPACRQVDHRCTNSHTIHGKDHQGSNTIHPTTIDTIHQVLPTPTPILANNHQYNTPSLAKKPYT
eukprot:1382033-Amorphochlora_amoeboformis.AAC.2